jgi:prepilin-type N-terminal cleavage/methylation domain-containing protein
MHTVLKNIVLGNTDAIVKKPANFKNTIAKNPNAKNFYSNDNSQNLKNPLIKHINLVMSSQKGSQKGFSLVEILVVMIIIMVLFTLAWNSFYSLRRTMRLRQSAENVKSEIRYAQRSAMFIKRGIDDNWVNGIGIDLRGFKDGDSEHTYSIFKWCSAEAYYTDFEDQKDFFKNAVDNGYGDCREQDPYLVVSGGKEDEYLTQSDVNVVIEPSDADVRFVLFEAVTGITHFYNADGEYVEADQVTIKFQQDGSSVGIGVSQEADIELEF